ncbi:MAG: Gfo/Idh/MocA family oxidoreductase [Chloroflexota bacterium]
MTTFEPDWRIPTGQGRELGIGIVGAGGIVQYAHLLAYRAAGLNVVAITDLDLDKARDVAARFDIPTVAANAEELVATPGVDIVDVAVTPWEQPRIVELATAAKRHLLCQKPFALDIEPARRMVDQAAAAGVKLAVNQQMRWEPGIAATRSLVRQGAIGRVSNTTLQVSIATPWHLWPWLAAAPRLEIMYHSVHYQDALRSILGDPVAVTSVHGRYPVQDPVIGETRTTTILEYADGSQALVDVDHYDQHAEPRAEYRIRGTDGALEGTIGLLYDYPDGRIDTLELRRPGVAPQTFDFEGVRWIPDAFLGPMSDLMDAIATDREPITSGRDNLRTLGVAFAIYRSVAERRTIDLTEEP